MARGEGWNSFEVEISKKKGGLNKGAGVQLLTPPAHKFFIPFLLIFFVTEEKV